MSTKALPTPAGDAMQGRTRPATTLRASVRTGEREAPRLARERAAPRSAPAVAAKGKRAKGIGNLGGRLAAATRMARLRAGRAAEERYSERR